MIKLKLIKSDDDIHGPIPHEDTGTPAMALTKDGEWVFGHWANNGVVWFKFMMIKTQRGFLNMILLPGPNYPILMSLTNYDHIH